MKSKENSSQGRIGNVYKSPAIGNLTINSITLESSDIRKWREAVDAARSATSPRRSLLYKLYDNIILDGHLTSVIQKRTISITNKKVQWVAKDGDVNGVDVIQKLILTAPWFYDLIKYIMESISWGHSLIELYPEKGAIKKVELINRYNVMPEYGFVSYNYFNASPSAESGIFYRDNPQQDSYLIEIGKAKDYGLMMIAAPYVLYKRGAIADWATFSELFGIPFRIGKYNPHDPRTRDLLYDALDKMGGKGFGVIPDGTSLEFFDSNGTGKSEVFKDMHSVMNEELSKLYLGGTMTIEDGASRSQGEVHGEGEDDINLSDMIMVEHYLNWVVLPRLQSHFTKGLLASGTFAFPETGQMPLADRIKIDMQVSQRIPFPEDYWYKTYGIEKPTEGNALPVANDPYASDEPSEEEGAIGSDKKKPPVKSKEEEEDEEPVNPAEKKKPKPSAMKAVINSLYAHALNCKQPKQVITIEAKKSRDEIWERIVKGVFEGTIKPGKIDPELHKWIADHLFKGVTSGFGGDLNKYDPKTPDHEMLAKLERDVQVFSAFKTHQELREITDMLTDDDGIVRGFSEFKNLVQAVDETYNVVWLAAEYNQAIASAQMASKWVDFQTNKDILPLLKYTTAGDDRVRLDHAKLEDVIKPVDDEFWDHYYPPNDWGCRCDVDQIADGEVTPTTEENLPVLKDMFDNNSAKSGTVFPAKHPYYDVQKKYEKAAEKNFGIKIPNTGDE